MEIVILILVIVLFVSAGLGLWLAYDIPKAGIDEAARENCAQCERDRRWYENQPWYVQVGIVVWWLANRAYCALKGC